MSNYDTGVQSPYEAKIVQDSLIEFSELSTWRGNFEDQWEDVAALVLPSYRNSFKRGSYNSPGQKMTEAQVDASGMMALHRFGAICDSLLTPRNSIWHTLSANDDYVMKDRATQLWFEDTTRRLFKYRYTPSANFSSQNQSNFQGLGAFGSMGMFVDELYSLTGEKGLRYRSMPMGELYLKENHQGLIDGFIRAFPLTARQAKVQFPDTFPAQLEAALEKQSQQPFIFLHRVCPRTDYDPKRLDHKGKAWASYYICLDAKTMVAEGGYRTFPAAISRYDQAPGEVYGRGPAMMVLPALKTLNAEKRTFLKAGHRAADPILITPDDGIVDFSMRPGALNKGGMSADGTPLIGTIPPGNIQISEEMMSEEKSLINDAFLVSLFQIMTETPQMSATEVIERVNEKGILIAPTMGRQQSEYLGSLIDRELDVMSQLRLLAPMPPRLKEAGGNYSVVYTSPLSRAMRAQEAAGFLRTVETVKELVNITQDMSLLDPFNFDVAIPDIAEIQAVPPSWMAGPDQIAAKRQKRDEQQQKQEAIQAAPAAAAMLKAQAVASKDGAAPQGQPNPATVPA